MQFVRNGPEIPERLLQAHEDGRVVFFCGAGISYPARLPGFEGLVEKLFENLNVPPNNLQLAAIKAKRFDSAIGLLESDFPGGREAVRREIVDILSPDFDAPNAIATHEALLTLSRTRSGRMRLVTTNFDRLFEETIHRVNLTVTRNVAPFLPIPKNRWDSVVYLHGLLPANPTGEDLNRLIVSSGDFGLAYLIERWAARFVSELFRNYMVCFVGYSINDPVLRYMTDALAADRLLGESAPEMFAFGSFSKSKEDAVRTEWSAKNVTPILYKEHSRHFYLHATLRVWANTYRDGVRGKERIVIENAMSPPMASTKQDNFVGRMLWALSDREGLPAKRFAEMEPTPPLDWLGPLRELRFGCDDLDRFGVPAASKDVKLTFCLIRRPTPYTHAPEMTIVYPIQPSVRLDRPMGFLVQWLSKHLGDPKLLIYLAQEGGNLHPQFVREVDSRLNEFDRQDGKKNAKDSKTSAIDIPGVVPRAEMLTLWRVFLSGRIKLLTPTLDLFSWILRLNRDGMSPSLRIELRRLLTPCISIRSPIRLPDETSDQDESLRIKDLVDWELVLASEHVHTAISELSKNPHWNSALPSLLDDFVLLLRDSLDLARELGGADDFGDRSYLHQPSISPHPQNKDYRDWTALIDLVREAWLALVDQSHDRARIAAERWWTYPYPLFKRLVFFAATVDGVIPPERAVDWLLADDHWWLWSDETQREVFRLLIVLSPQLDGNLLEVVENAILVGPPRDMFDPEMTSDEWKRLTDREIWLRLAKLNSSGVTLGATAAGKLVELEAMYPRWKLSPDDREEFPFWVGDGDEWRSFLATPRRRRELIDWLKSHPKRDAWQDDDWRQRCRDSFCTTLFALFSLSRANEWPTERWKEALSAWSIDELAKKSWRHVAPIMIGAPDHVIGDLTHALAWWLQEIAKVFDENEDLFVRLCRKVLRAVQPDGKPPDDPVGKALNHSVGLTTDALLRWWYRSGLEDDQGLPEDLVSIFNEICDVGVDKFRHGRVLLAAHTITLYRVDNNWTRGHLIPLFDWSQSAVEAKGAWEGFLWAPRVYGPLMEEMKNSFLETSRHYADLGKHDRQYASVLTFVALDPKETFSPSELASAVHSLPIEGLRESANALTRSLDAAGEQAENYWTHRVKPYLRRIWPKSIEFVSEQISESLGRLCIAASDQFPDALLMVRPWLIPVEHPDFLVRKLNESGLCSRFPELSLEYLDLVVGVEPKWVPAVLKASLDVIVASSPEIGENPKFRRLDELVRRARP